LNGGAERRSSGSICGPDSESQESINTFAVNCTDALLFTVGNPTLEDETSKGVRCEHRKGEKHQHVIALIRDIVIHQ
jgi:hypothetical protein